MNRPSAIRLAVLPLAAALALPALAAGWSSFEHAFPALPCQDGWSACKTATGAIGAGTLKDGAGRPIPSDMRIGWFDLQPTANLSPFVGLSAYDGPIGGQAPVADAGTATNGGATGNNDAGNGATAGNGAGNGASDAGSNGSAPVGNDAGSQTASNTPPETTHPTGSATPPTTSGASTGSATTSMASNPPPSTGGGSINPNGSSATGSSINPNGSSSINPNGSSSIRPSGTNTTTPTTTATVASNTTSGSMNPNGSSSMNPNGSSSMNPNGTSSGVKVIPPAGTPSGATTVSNTPPSSTANIAVASDDCSDLVKLEPSSMLGALTPGQVSCLNARLGTESLQTTKDKVSRVLIQNAEAKGDKAEWSRLMKNHLENIDRSDPDMCFKYALDLSRGGVGRAQGVIRWSDVALENKAKWSGDTYKKRVFQLYKLRAEAANKLWEDAENDFMTKEHTDENEAKAQKFRGQAKDFAREWLDYAKASEQDTKTAMALCVSASGNRAFCDGG